MATLEISAPEYFAHAGNLAAYQSSNDPRDPSFAWDDVVIDLRNCEFIYPAAALWCTIYPLLVSYQSVGCELLVPLNKGVALYLKELGLFDILKESGVEADDRDLATPESPQVILPLTPLSSQLEVQETENFIIESLGQRGLTSSNLYTDVSVAFGELGNNAVEHAESPIGAYGMVQFYHKQGGRRFVCAIADGGIGIKESLTRIPEHKRYARYDWTAIEYATQERISGTKDKHRGIGLYEIANDMLRPDRELLLHSGLGFLHLEGEAKQPAHRTDLFPGTSALVYIPC